MLKGLRIKNFILIDQLSVEFGKGLNVITGETGAGKSIILGALGMVYGQRADLSTLRNADSKAVIEANIQIDQKLESWFIDEELDFDSDTILRREILPSGKSRAFINDTPVRLDTLQNLSSRLISFHAQHENLEMNSASFQLWLVDVMANHKDLLNDFRKSFTDYTVLMKELKAVESEIIRLKADSDYKQFLLEELDAANINELDEEELGEELNKLRNASHYQEKLSELCYLLGLEGQAGLLDQFGAVNQLAEQISVQEMVSLSERLDSLKMELDDIGQSINQLLSMIEPDDMRLAILEDQQSKLFHLQQKHQVNSLDELRAIQSELSQSFEQNEHLEQQKRSLEKETNELQKKLEEHANQLHQNRLQVVSAIEKQTTNLLIDMGMPSASFEVNLTRGEQLVESGFSNVNFLFSANKGQTVGPINKIASGGELSRLALALKSMVSGKASLASLVFDEIDTGISGETAARVSELMQKMSRHQQLIVITHLPQMASKGDVHLKVVKQEDGDTTKTSMKCLNQEERVLEIAKMLSGASVSDLAISNAKELLS